MGFLMKGLAALIAVIYAAIVVLIERQSYGMFAANGASLTALPLVVVVCCSLWALGEILDRLKTLLDRQGALSVPRSAPAPTAAPAPDPVARAPRSATAAMENYPPMSARPSVRDR